ncbi:hypothetical protein BKG95_03655 [Rodentibacter pneumotropicus]|uniref:hypothetical protein n=1 Tax=Rodentibacter pneumotropicus TaxID=758 RepID=UPI0009890763|nr:hypothetical protein [Rodentibacter pneumotropicus]OOF68506.1 hypothetical protein BKG95_03655 [Rodentibacter pneumotropicus]THA07271.1 hypothetical protein D3M73_02625 [Rodentibacter pneumotropicus]THA10418.1 hypothetical protein D3M81_10595 [Rodentibacter pneumotropicus]
MNAEDFIIKHIRNQLIQGGADMVSVNQATEMCLQEYRRRSTFKPDVMTYLLDKAKKFVSRQKKRQKG